MKVTKGKGMLVGLAAVGLALFAAMNKKPGGASAATGGRTSPACEDLVRSYKVGQMTYLNAMSAKDMAMAKAGADTMVRAYQGMLASSCPVNPEQTPNPFPNGYPFANA